MECTVSWTGASGTRSAMGFVAETGSGADGARDGARSSAATRQLWTTLHEGAQHDAPTQRRTGVPLDCMLITPLMSSLIRRARSAPEHDGPCPRLERPPSTLVGLSLDAPGTISPNLP